MSMSLINTVICIGGALCLHLLFEAPFANLEKELLQARRRDDGKSKDLCENGGQNDLKRTDKCELSSRTSDSLYSSGSSLSNPDCSVCVSRTTSLPVSQYSAAWQRWHRHEYIPNFGSVGGSGNESLPVQQTKTHFV
jgi:hypothetical protein